MKEVRENGYNNEVEGMYEEDINLREFKQSNKLYMLRQELNPDAFSCDGCGCYSHPNSKERF